MRWAGMPSMACPANRMLPESGRSTPEIRLSAVVLPEPLGPSRPTIWPDCTVKIDGIDRDKPAEGAGQRRDLKHGRGGCGGDHACTCGAAGASDRLRLKRSHTPTTPWGSA